MLIIWPKYIAAVEKDEDDDVKIREEIIQSVLALIVILGVVYSYVSKQIKMQVI